VTRQGQQPPTIALIGGGAAGTLVAQRLLRDAPDGTNVVLVESARPTGRGVAYSTTEPQHLLNVPAGMMSAFSDEPDHFTRWVRGRQRVSSGDYLPRSLYGSYLAETLDDAAARRPAVTLTRRHDRVVRVRTAGAALTLTTASGADLTAHAAVLAIGGQPPDCAWAPDELRGSARFVPDPWAPGALAAVGERDDVLIVGTGLTAADTAIALDRPGRIVHAVSRTGRWPRFQPRSLGPALPAPALPDRLDLGVLRDVVLRQVATAMRVHHDWRPGVDSLRPVTAEIWRRLDVHDRQRFLTSHRRLWETHRHRMPPMTGSRLLRMTDAGRLRTGRAAVTAVEDTGGALRVTLSDERTLTVGTVVNCTGQTIDNPAADPLVAGLLRDGLARRAALGLGLETDDGGRLLPDAGPPAPLWTLGSLRLGMLWESTAIREIRDQADAVAAQATRALATEVVAGG
jgi:uncharacterized NAD(P)/FAD-binding protein YdhS